MDLIPVHALTENYLCLLNERKHAGVAKPVEAGLMRVTHASHDAPPESILVTHRQAVDAGLLPSKDELRCITAKRRGAGTRRSGSIRAILRVLPDPQNAAAAAPDTPAQVMPRNDHTEPVASDL